MTILYSDVEPLSKYSPVTLQLSPATRILNENPVLCSKTWQKMVVIDYYIAVPHMVYSQKTQKLVTLTHTLVKNKMEFIWR